MATINWYPGHIAKAKNKLKEYISLVDVIVEVFDARLPCCSRYTDIQKIVGQKPILILMNKIDLADEEENLLFKQLLDRNNQPAILYSAISNRDADKVIKQIEKLGKPAIDKIVAKGRLPRPIRTMVIGMPNVGKSSVINSLIKRSKVKVASRAGVTRDMQWVRIHPKVDLLDTPGLIYPQLENQLDAAKLACVSSVGDKTYDELEVARILVHILAERYEVFIRDFYHLEATADISIENIGKSRNWLLKGNKIDIIRTASLVLKDFRQGKMGRYTLEDCC